MCDYLSKPKKMLRVCIICCFNLDCGTFIHFVPDGQICGLSSMFGWKEHDIEDSRENEQNKKFLTLKLKKKKIHKEAFLLCWAVLASLTWWRRCGWKHLEENYRSLRSHPEPCRVSDTGKQLEWLALRDIGTQPQQQSLKHHFNRFSGKLTPNPRKKKNLINFFFYFSSSENAMHKKNHHSSLNRDLYWSICQNICRIIFPPHRSALWSHWVHAG